MIKHYFKVALRNLFHYKLFSFINILSLSIGLSCFLLCLIYLINETTYDKFNKNEGSIYRVYEWSKGQNGTGYSGDAWLYLPLGPELKNNFPDIKDFVRVKADGTEHYIEYGNKTIKLPITYTDSSFFRFFSLPMLYGNPSTVLAKSSSVVLTRKYSRILFGDEYPIGRIIKIKTGDQFDNFLVTGVTDDIPSNSSVSFDVLLNLTYYESTSEGQIASSSWNFSGFQNFVLLDPNSNLAQQPEKLVSFRKKYFPDEQAQLIKDGSWDGKGLPSTNFRLQPLADIHTNLFVTAGNDNHPIDKNAILILVCIATGILVIGCVNFTTLAIARSFKRIREIGVRKVIGGQKNQIVVQFLTESFLLSCIAGSIALLLAWLFMPIFNSMVSVNLNFSLFRYPELSWAFACVVFVSGFLAGIYPAFVLANLGIVTVLKNRVRINGSNIFTKGLIAGQYILSIGLVIATIVILKQLNYMRTMDIGFNKDNVIVINAEETDGSKTLSLLKNSLKNNDYILGITGSTGTFQDSYNVSGFTYNGKNHPALNFSCNINFLSVMGMHLVAGRMLDEHKTEDTINSVIVNEALVRDLALTNKSILGMKLENYSANPKYDPVIVGVVSNYNLLPVKQQISPALFRQKSTYKPSVFYVHIKPGNPTYVLKVLNAAWQEVTNDILFDYSFLDDDLNARYQQENRLSNIVVYSAIICIFLASLGLGGIAYLSAENRTKELVIRKVFGGSWSDIWYILAKDFIRLVLLAFIIAAPLSWYFLHAWLEGYAFRVHISGWIYILTGIGVLFFTFMILSTTIIKIVFMRPTKGLKTE